MPSNMKHQEPYDHHDGQVGPLGRLTRETREAAGLSQRQVAEAIGVSRELISRLESGSCQNISPAPLMRFAKRFNVSSADLCAAAGWMLPTELPNFAAYLHAKHPDWADQWVDELTDFYDFVKQKHSLH